MIDWKIIAIIASVIAIAIALAFVLLPSLLAPSAVESDHFRRPGLLASLSPLTLLLQRARTRTTPQTRILSVSTCACVPWRSHRITLDPLYAPLHPLARSTRLPTT